MKNFQMWLPIYEVSSHLFSNQIVLDGSDRYASRMGMHLFSTMKGTGVVRVGRISVFFKVFSYNSYEENLLRSST